MPDLTDKLPEMIKFLPEKLKKVAEGAYELYLWQSLFMPLLPYKIRKKMATSMWHTIVKGFKLVNWDTEARRNAMKNLCICMYDLEDEWMPKNTSMNPESTAPPVA